ncbi:MAG: AAA family ATPase, partial [Patescibacteria group bacterium]
MTKIGNVILEIDKVISSNIGRFDDSERGLLSQNILSQLRNFVEHISLKIYSDHIGSEIEINFPNITLANEYVKSRGNLRFLSKFHRFLQISASHYTLDEGNSERLMLKYYEYLLKVKSFLKKAYGIDVLKNINEFPIRIDSALKEYYERITEKINEQKHSRVKSSYTDRYYIQKIKPFFVNYEVYYEVTFTTANDKASKFDRIIAFTKLDISPNYSVKLTISNDIVNVLGKRMPIQIIDEWEISIRPCELDHFADIFGQHKKIQSVTAEYRELMLFLKQTGFNLVDVVNASDDYYQEIKETVTQKAKVTCFFDALDQSHELVKNNAPGSNVLKYLLYRLSNRILKKQYKFGNCPKLSNLNLNYGCIPFDQMPFTTSLINHNPKLSDLFDCIDPTAREHELFARHIKNNTETKGQLYTPDTDIHGFENVDELIKSHNRALYYTHGHRRIENFKKHFFIQGYEQETLHILEKLKALSSAGIKNYSNSVDSWLQSTTHQIDSDEKKEKLRLMFENSEVALVYGSAGTGKTTLINHVSNFFNDRNKLYLANTNPAIDNLKRRVNAANCSFMTIAKFLSHRNEETDFDLLIIDECSTVSNTDMLKVLEKASFKLLILVGDIFQIESIRFGNWFSVAGSFIPSSSVFELVRPYRTKNDKLLDLWGRVRNIDETILEHITKNGYSLSLDDSIFDHSEEDEIILCLNYDGLYGINNINKFLQSNNSSPSIRLSRERRAFKPGGECE